MDIAKCCSIVKSLLKTSDTGLTPKELIEKARSNGVDRPLMIARKLVNEDGVARVDRGKNGRPTRIKATRKLFDQEAS